MKILTHVFLGVFICWIDASANNTMTVSAEGLEGLVHNEKTLKKVAVINPKAVEKLAHKKSSNGFNPIKATKEF